ncbi:MAG: thioredoxin family protein [Candidatus Moranbacteria bacterium]|nr:thioredoxin family protein [Candidatus Moranbacteria bacterium]
MKLKVFTKNDCPNCPPAKELAQKIENEGKIEVELFNTDEADGLAEAQFYAVLATPSLILCDKNEDEVEAWRGEVPTREEVYKKI